MEVASVGDSIELTNRVVPTRLLVVLTFVGLVVGVLGWTYAITSGPGDEFRADRQAVITRTSDFAVTFNTFEMSKPSDYQRRVKKLVTPKFYREFTKVTDAMFKALKDRNQASGDVKVLSVAVDTIDKDSAVAIVAINTSVRISTEKAAVLRRFRWQVSLTKRNDQWRVNKFDAVPAMQATLGDVTSKEGNQG